MVERNIIEIDEDKCTGCGLCIPNCPEGAIQIIDGKARLISDLFCDGLGACLGHCPEKAITVVKREAEPYEEAKVMENIIKCGPNTIKAHLTHLKDHGEQDLYGQAVSVLNEKGLEVPVSDDPNKTSNCGGGGMGCPGAKMMDFARDPGGGAQGDTSSQLSQWPIQLHLVSPTAPYYQGRDVVISADCVAYSIGSFHNDFLKGNALAIACPKLDDGRDIYVEKIKSMIDDAKINTLTVVTMEVPCCGGLLQIVTDAIEKADRNIPLKHVMIGIKGDVLIDEWV
ncbi:ATP-binding protein [Candidatus Altiarchaeota archaeon]